MGCLDDVRLLWQQQPTALSSTLALLACNLPVFPLPFSESKKLVLLQTTILKGDADNWQNSAQFWKACACLFAEILFAIIVII